MKAQRSTIDTALAVMGIICWLGAWAAWSLADWNAPNGGYVIVLFLFTHALLIFWLLRR